MMEKRPIFVDMDSTIVNSQKAICDVYNKVFSTFNNFVPADWTKVERWDFSDQCTLLPELNLTVTDLFKSPEFFEVVEFYEGAKEVLEELSKETDIIVCTAGTPENISHKVLWLHKHLPFADIVPVIIKKSNGYGKKIVNMEGAILIDDHAHNLETSNAEIKICFGQEYPWNKNFKGLRITKWDNYVLLLLKTYVNLGKNIKATKNFINMNESIRNIALSFIEYEMEF